MLLIAEVPRSGLPREAPEQLAERASRLARAGVDALSVNTDSEATPCGLRDLFHVVRAVPKTPVFRRDWFIHPLQVRRNYICISVKLACSIAALDISSHPLSLCWGSKEQHSAITALTGADHRS